MSSWMTILTAGLVAVPAASLIGAALARWTQPRLASGPAGTGSGPDAVRFDRHGPDDPTVSAGPRDRVPGRSPLAAIRGIRALAELRALRALAEALPQPAWALDDAGRLVWANPAYRALAALAAPPSGGPGTTDDAPLFATTGADPEADPEAEPGQGAARRQRLPLRLAGRAEPRWYKVASVRCGPGSLHVAAEVGLVQGEATTEAVMRLVPAGTGLAVFDRTRRLAASNAALAEVTGLSPAFLADRPPLDAVLGRLRAAGALPEPSGRVAWRDQVAALDAAAREGRYDETWTPPDGRTWRVAGRALPGGALALLFEDHSDEVALVRRLRSEIETARGVLDRLPEAVAVFSAAGTLSLSNAAYAALWGPPAGGLSDPHLLDEAARWAARAPSPFWARLAPGPREAGTGIVTMPGGRVVAVRAAPLPQGATLVRFGPAGRDGAED